ncbi:MAG: thiopurine S-methyltransferase [Deltaproteobacteria bacterium]|nr:thiopurine S-methyltransferase [Deltaproteobacteria bacterium]
MDPEFWRARWAERQIGFHRDQPNSVLVEQWAGLDLPASARVLVPLCGKSLDVAYLAGLGHEVVGVELSEIAVRELFHEAGVRPVTEQRGPVTVHRAGRITVLEGDLFDVGPDVAGRFDAVFDRAALIALPPALRERYARHVLGLLAPAARMLVVTLEMTPPDAAGPPHHVSEEEVRAHYSARFHVERLGEGVPEPVSPGLSARGVGAVREVGYRLVPRS